MISYIRIGDTDGGSSSCCSGWHYRKDSTR
nr:MAG TPA: hypothetical protein [Caudoviricetes sp.]